MEDTLAALSRESANTGLPGRPLAISVSVPGSTNSVCPVIAGGLGGGPAHAPCPVAGASGLGAGSADAAGVALVPSPSAATLAAPPIVATINTAASDSSRLP